MQTALLDYELPTELIATAPAEPRDAARLMVVRRATGEVEHRHVRDLPDIMGGPAAGDVMVFNQTRVLPAWFAGVRLLSGGKVQGLYLASPLAADPGVWEVMLESRGTLRVGESVSLAPGAILELLESRGRGAWLARLHGDRTTHEVLEAIGSTPLPPYIRKQRRAAGAPEVGPDDAGRYNTVYAAAPGSVAAPTAGLHFTPELLRRLGDAGVGRAMVTLHVGLGTFAPVRAERIEDHDIHREPVDIDASALTTMRAARDAGKRIIAVGTTTVRAIESLPDDWRSRERFTADTKLFITPDNGFRYRFTDALMTNFHLPKSTLLALVAALPGVGVDRLLGWYRAAIAERYRFYSYGDAMLLI